GKELGTDDHRSHLRALTSSSPGMPRPGTGRLMPWLQGEHLGTQARQPAELALERRGLACQGTPLPAGGPAARPSACRGSARSPRRAAWAWGGLLALLRVGQAWAGPGKNLGFQVDHNKEDR